MEGVRIFLVIIVFSVECHAMSNTELEDFKEFLEKTSALDHTLKDGFNHNEDEDETVSEHAWEESGKFEGDLILSDRQRHLIVEDVAEGLSRNGLNDITKRWPNNEVIYYIQREHFSGGQVQAIQDGIEDIGQSSCISFRPYKKGDRDAVVIQGSRRGCFSQVGYQGGYQVLNLSGRHPVGRGCFRHGTVVHELLHTLGFYHMQSSPDRDDYIDVIWENIVERAKHNFRKYNSFAVTDFGVGYDYDSVLHYSKRAFTKNGKATLVPKQDSVSIGQRVGMSNKDKDKLNKMYCDKDSNNNFEQNDDSIEQSDKKKQLTKTKPFQGHGIGYHQGKAVVIKLPTADTYSLPDLPSYHLYDYFSKVPETLAPAYSAAFGGQDDGYKILESEYDGIYKSPPKAKHDKKDDKEFKSTKKEEKPLNKDLNIENLNQPSGNNNTKQDLELDAALDDAFDRLKKIIKTHVYPTRGVDVKPYKDDKESKSKNYYEDIERIKDKITKDTKSSVKSYDRPSIDTLTKIIKTHEYPTHEVNIKPYKEDKELLTKSKSYYEDLKIIKDKISTDTKSSDENDDLPKIDTLRQKIKTHIYPTHIVDVEPYEENKEIRFKNYYEDIERLKDKIAKETKSSDENDDRPRINDSKGLLSHRLPKNVADFEDSMEKRLETILKSFGQHENIRKLSGESGYGDYYEPHSDSYRIHPTNEKITHGWHFNQEEPYESYYKPKKLLYK